MYMRHNIVSHFMSLCRFSRKMGLSLGAKSGRSDIIYPKRLHQVALDHDRSATAYVVLDMLLLALLRLLLLPLLLLLLLVLLLMMMMMMMMLLLLLLPLMMMMLMILLQVLLLLIKTGAPPRWRFRRRFGCCCWRYS